MKIIYLGTPDFAVIPLLRLIESRHEILAVVTNIDKKVGRKQILTACPVKQVAEKHNIKTFSYEKISKEGVEDLKALGGDIMITCAFGQILSQEIIDICPHGVINIHGSILPKYRGASPIQQAILNGDKEVGVTIMQTTIGIDSGDIILTEKIPLDTETGCEKLFSLLSQLGGEAIIKALTKIEGGKATFTPQNHELACKVSMIKKQDGLLDFNKTSVELHNKVRAFDMWPIAYTFLNGKMLKIYKTKVVNNENFKGGVIGEIVEDKSRLVVKTADGYLEILQLQIEGGKSMPTKTFVLGRQNLKGEILA